MLSQEQLKSVLHYCPETGIFTWLKSARSGWVGKSAGSVMNRGYACIQLSGKSYLAHRLAWLYTQGFFPEFIDHINSDRLDNRIANLRPATRRQNNINVLRTSANTSGFKGVHWDKPTERWRAQITIEGKKTYLGSFASPEEAHEAYKKAALEHHGEFANFG